MELAQHVGQRLSYNGDRCTVRYIGHVEGQAGNWLGVEWDDPSRGKNSGTFNNVQYFKCASSHSSPASFVRATRRSDVPVNFVEAVKNKYASESPADSESLIVISGKEVEEVGFDKVRRQLANLRELRVVVIDAACIGRKHAHPKRRDSSSRRKSKDITDNDISKDIEISCPKITELDISRNLFETLDEILAIVTKLPNLASLKIDGNRLSDSSAMLIGVLPETPPFSKIASLSVDNCLLTWNDICHVASPFVALSSLSAGRNELTHVSDAVFPANLTYLNLENNFITNLVDIEPLSRLTSLKKLILKGNEVASILKARSQDRSDSRIPLFPSSIQDVDLSYNQISEWKFIDELNNVFPGLNALRTSSNPIFYDLADTDGRKLSADDGYMLTIARLGCLTKLNFSLISPKERLNAETYYLSQIGKELSSRPEAEASTILARNPRYDELCEKYGEPVIARRTASFSNPNFLAAQLTQITFKLDESILDTERSGSPKISARSWEFKVPKSFSIYNVLGMVGKHFGLRPMLLKLVWETGEEETMPDAEVVARDTEKDDHPPLYREEVLVPRTRRIGTWIDEKSASVRVEWSEEDVKRHKVAVTALTSQNNP